MSDERLIVKQVPGRKLDVSTPGHLYVATKEGHFIGAKAVTFAGASDLNAFFEKTAGQVIISLEPMSDGTVFCVYTSTMSDDDRELLTTRAEVIAELTAERTQAKRAELEAQQAAEAAEEAELKRLAGIGAKCEKVHKGKG